MSQLQSLSGKTALITGSSRGIGRGIALRLAEKGARVAINYLRDESAAQDTIASVRAAGGDGFIVQADVSQPGEVLKLMQKVGQEFGQLDILVSNAIGKFLEKLVPPLQASLEQFEEAFREHSRAYLNLVQQAAPLLRDKGRIVAISYWPGSHGGGFLPYFSTGANKAAMEAMTRYFAIALAPRAITVNTICAGITEGSVLNALPPQAQDAMREWMKQGWNPRKRPGTSEEIGGAVAAICAEEAGWITGQTIVADGGASLMDPEVPLFFQLPS